MVYLSQLGMKVSRTTGFHFKGCKTEAFRAMQDIMKMRRNAHIEADVGIAGHLDPEAKVRIFTRYGLPAPPFRTGARLARAHQVLDELGNLVPADRHAQYLRMKERKGLL